MILKLVKPLAQVVIKTIRTLPQIANVPPAKVVLLGLWHNQQPLQTDLS